jgi:hypothetical protein
MWVPSGSGLASTLGEQTVSTRRSPLRVGAPQFTYPLAEPHYQYWPDVEAAHLNNIMDGPLHASLDSNFLLQLRKNDTHPARTMTWSVGKTRADHVIVRRTNAGPRRASVAATCLAAFALSLFLEPLGRKRTQLLTIGSLSHLLNTSCGSLNFTAQKSLEEAQAPDPFGDRKHRLRRLHTV